MKTNAPTALVITAIAIGIIAATFATEYQFIYPRPYHIIDRETISISERSPLIYLKTEDQLFPAGSVLTSNENEELVLATDSTPEDLIVGIVNKYGYLDTNYRKR